MDIQGSMWNISPTVATAAQRKRETAGSVNSISRNICFPLRNLHSTTSIPRLVTHMNTSSSSSMQIWFTGHLPNFLHSSWESWPSYYLKQNRSTNIMTIQVHNAQEHIISKTGNPIWNHYVLTITLTMQQFAVYKKDI